MQTLPFSAAKRLSGTTRSWVKRVAHARLAPFTTVMLEKPKLKMRSDMDLAVGPKTNFQI